MNYYVYEKLAEAHRQHLHCEAEQERLLAQLPGQHQSRDKDAVYELGSFLTRLGMLFLSVPRNWAWVRIITSTTDSDPCICCMGEID